MKKIIVLFLFLLVWAFVVRPPVSGGTLTSWYGVRFFADRSFHTGSDIGAPTGTPIRSISWGTVKETGHDERGGNYVYISHLSLIETRYLHLDSISVTAGQQVDASQLIGTMGNTGISTGSHLHYEIRVLGLPLPPHALCLPGRLVDTVGGYKFLQSKTKGEQLDRPKKTLPPAP